MESKDKKTKKKCKFFRIFDIKKIPCDFARITGSPIELYYRIKLHSESGKENIKIKDGAMIISNHTGYSDPVALSCLFWRRRLNYLTAKEVFGKKFRSLLLKLLGCIKIDRKIFDIEAVKKSIEIMKDGGVMVVFPEGKIERREDIADFKSGAILMAHKAGVPIIPVYIEKRENKRKRLNIAVGDKIYTKDLFAKKIPTAAELNEASAYLREREKELKDLIEKDKEIQLERI